MEKVCVADDVCIMLNVGRVWWIPICCEEAAPEAKVFETGDGHTIRRIGEGERQ
jgi:hypothetical protein